MLKRKGIRGRSVHRTEVVVDRDNFGRKILASFLRHDRQVCCGRKLPRHLAATSSRSLALSYPRPPTASSSLPRPLAASPFSSLVL